MYETLLKKYTIPSFLKFFAQTCNNLYNSIKFKKQLLSDSWKIWYLVKSFNSLEFFKYEMLPPHTYKKWNCPRSVQPPTYIKKKEERTAVRKQESPRKEPKAKKLYTRHMYPFMSLLPPANVPLSFYYYPTHRRIFVHLRLSGSKRIKSAVSEGHFFHSPSFSSLSCCKTQCHVGGRG